MKHNELYEMQSGGLDSKCSSIEMKKNQVYELTKEKCSQYYEN